MNDPTISFPVHIPMMTARTLMSVVAERDISRESPRVDGSNTVSLIVRMSIAIYERIYRGLKSGKRVRILIEDDDKSETIEFKLMLNTVLPDNL